MRIPLHIWGALLTLLPAARGLDDRAMLRAIAAVETDSRPWRIGRAGERSAWQFMPATWRIYTPAPFVEASRNEVLAQIVAFMHLHAIEAKLARAEKPITARAIARAWNPGAPRDYAERVGNLYGAEARETRK